MSVDQFIIELCRDNLRQRERILDKLAVDPGRHVDRWTPGVIETAKDGRPGTVAFCVEQIEGKIPLIDKARAPDKLETQTILVDLSIV